MVEVTAEVVPACSSASASTSLDSKDNSTHKNIVIVDPEPLPSQASPSSPSASPMAPAPVPAAGQTHAAQSPTPSPSPSPSLTPHKVIMPAISSSPVKPTPSVPSSTNVSPSLAEILRMLEHGVIAVDMHKTDHPPLSDTAMVELLSSLGAAEGRNNPRGVIEQLMKHHASRPGMQASPSPSLSPSNGPKFPLSSASFHPPSLPLPHSSLFPRPPRPSHGAQPPGSCDTDSSGDDVHVSGERGDKNPMDEEWRKALKERWEEGKRDIAWRWHWLDLQTRELQQQVAVSEQQIDKMRKAKQKVLPVWADPSYPASLGPDHQSLRTAGMTPPKKSRKLCRRAVTAMGKPAVPMDAATCHPLFSFASANEPQVSDHEPLPAPRPPRHPSSSVPGASSARRHKDRDRSRHRHRMSEDDFDSDSSNEVMPIKRKKLTNKDYDLDNVVIPFSISGSNFSIPVTQYKEIDTPKWRSVSMADAPVPSSPASGLRSPPLRTRPLAASDTPQTRPVPLSTRRKLTLSQIVPPLELDKNVSPRGETSQSSQTQPSPPPMLPSSPLMSPSLSQSIHINISESQAAFLTPQDVGEEPPALPEEVVRTEQRMVARFNELAESTDASSESAAAPSVVPNGDGGSSTSEEDTDNEVYARRHVKRELEERRRYLASYLEEQEKKKKKKKAPLSSSHGPGDTPPIPDSEGEHEEGPPPATPPTTPPISMTGSTHNLVHKERNAQMEKLRVPTEEVLFTSYNLEKFTGCRLPEYLLNRRLARRTRGEDSSSDDGSSDSSTHADSTHHHHSHHHHPHPPTHTPSPHASPHPSPHPSNKARRGRPRPAPSPVVPAANKRAGAEPDAIWTSDSDLELVTIPIGLSMRDLSVRKKKLLSRIDSQRKLYEAELAAGACTSSSIEHSLERVQRIKAQDATNAAAEYATSVQAVSNRGRRRGRTPSKAGCKDIDGNEGDVEDEDVDAQEDEAFWGAWDKEHRSDQWWWDPAHLDWEVASSAGDTPTSTDRTPPSPSPSLTTSQPGPASLITLRRRHTSSPADASTTTSSLAPLDTTTSGHPSAPQEPPTQSIDMPDASPMPTPNQTPQPPTPQAPPTPPVSTDEVQDPSPSCAVALPDDSDVHMSPQDDVALHPLSDSSDTCMTP
eukprot:TRINITY_DN999_c0_g1_i2.p1 TRINITY_DN999_c0_g1~~TRINITY_DN999_c0_g1_i2.p1  ORF type:complete len:1139 (+),score=303.07 TRINITY_DN999_c0_g1_i2:181-3597(+)